jgi:hypothetical protein
MAHTQVEVAQRPMKGKTKSFVMVLYEPKKMCGEYDVEEKWDLSLIW